MAGMPKGYDDLEKLAKQVTAKAKYPIRNVEELITAFGGEEASFTFEGRSGKVGQVKRAIPKDFFPIGSQEDLIAKSAHVLMARGLVGTEFTPGQRLDKPPKNAEEPGPIKEGPSRGGMPAVAGIKKKGAAGPGPGKPA